MYGRPQRDPNMMQQALLALLTAGGGFLGGRQIARGRQIQERQLGLQEENAEFERQQQVKAQALRERAFGLEEEQFGHRKEHDAAVLQQQQEQPRIDFRNRRRLERIDQRGQVDLERLRQAGRVNLTELRTKAASGDKFSARVMDEMSRLRRETGLSEERVAEEAVQNTLRAWGQQAVPAQPQAPAPAANPLPDLLRRINGAQLGGGVPPAAAQVPTTPGIAGGAPSTIGQANIQRNQSVADVNAVRVPQIQSQTEVNEARIPVLAEQANLTKAKTADVPAAAGDRRSRANAAVKNANTGAARQQSTAQNQQGRLAETKRHNEAMENLRSAAGASKSAASGGNEQARIAAGRLLTSYQQEVSFLRRKEKDAPLTPEEQLRVGTLSGRINEMRDVLGTYAAPGGKAAEPWSLAKKPLRLKHIEGFKKAMGRKPTPEEARDLYSRVEAGQLK